MAELELKSRQLFRSPSLMKLGAVSWMKCESDIVTKGSTDEGIAENKRTHHALQTFTSRSAGKQSGIIETVCWSPTSPVLRLDNGVGSFHPARKTHDCIVWHLMNSALKFAQGRSRTWRLIKSVPLDDCVCVMCVNREREAQFELMEYASGETRVLVINICVRVLSHVEEAAALGVRFKLRSGPWAIVLVKAKRFVVWGFPGSHVRKLLRVEG